MSQTNSNEQSVLDALANGPQSLEAMSESTGLAVDVVNGLATTLLQKGLVVRSVAISDSSTSGNKGVDPYSFLWQLAQ